MPRPSAIYSVISVTLSKLLGLSIGSISNAVKVVMVLTGGGKGQINTLDEKGIFLCKARFYKLSDGLESVELPLVYIPYFFWASYSLYLY